MRSATAILPLEECPYKKVCNCPGREVNSKGFLESTEGILCQEWKVLVGKSALATLKKMGGRPPTYNLETVEKLEAAQRKYWKSEKGKRALRNYAESPKGQKAIRKYQNSEKGKLTRQRYYQTDKGKAAHLSQNEQDKLFRLFIRWEKSHPGKTMTDFLKEQV